MSERPLISVVIPAYNAERWIETAVRSVFAQTWRPLELIVVDDGSSDTTAELVEHLLTHEAHGAGVATELVRQANRGAPAARNLGTRHARGELLRFLDADDWLTSDSIERHAAAMSAEPRLELACGTVQVLYDLEDGTYVAGNLAARGMAEDAVEEAFRRPSTAAYLHRFTIRRRLFERVGGFNESLARSQEYDLVTRMLLCEPPLWHRPDLCGYYRHHNGTRISNLSEAATATAMIGIADNLVQQLAAQGGLTPARREAAARLIYLAAVRPALLGGRIDVAETAMAVARVTEPAFEPPTRYERHALRLPAWLGYRLIRAGLRFTRWRNRRRIFRGPRLPLAAIQPPFS